MILEARSRYPREVEPASGCVGLPSPFSAVWVYPPWCTLAANLQEVQTFSVPPAAIAFYQILTLQPNYPEAKIKMNKIQIK